MVAGSQQLVDFVGGQWIGLFAPEPVVASAMSDHVNRLIADLFAAALLQDAHGHPIAVDPFKPATSIGEARR